MWEILKTVLYLSIIGAGASAVLILIKPFTVKRLPVRWQYYIWLLVAVCMLVPFWKLIPQHRAQQLTRQFTPAVQTQQVQIHPAEPANMNLAPEAAPYSATAELTENGMRIYDCIAYIWLAGAGVFLTLALGSYAVFVYTKRKNSIALKGNVLFEMVKKELKIKRKIKIRISKDTDSPMLVGTLFPVIYLPMCANDEQALAMVFRHELTHYRHGDLLYKWLTLFVNAVHWFNPFAYLLSANVNQACEVACDMAVIKNMSDSDKQFYMETILNMVERGKKHVSEFLYDKNERKG